MGRGDSKEGGRSSYIVPELVMIGVLEVKS